jgi:Ca2+:H+ antiporter
MSHGVSVIMLATYVLFMIFQLWTHAESFSNDAPGHKSTRYSAKVKAGPRRALNKLSKIGRSNEDGASEAEGSAGEVAEGATTATETKAVAQPSGTAAVADIEKAESEDDDEEEEEVPQMNMPVTIIVMVVVAVIVGVTAEFLVDSINGMVETHPSLSPSFVGLILLPIVGNAAEHFTAISVAVKDKLDLAISVAVGSSIQIALFVVPICELLAWCINKPMTLLFDPFQSVMLFFSVLIVNQTMGDGRSNWMEGVILVFLYIIMAVAFWYYPGSEPIIACK